jgi:hypothetical protein
MTLDQLLAHLTDPAKLTVGFVLALLVISFYKEWLVSGKTYRKRCDDYDAQVAKLEKDRDEFKLMALRSIEITERTQRVRGTALTVSSSNESA